MRLFVDVFCSRFVFNLLQYQNVWRRSRGKVCVCGGVLLVAYFHLVPHESQKTQPQGSVSDCSNEADTFYCVTYYTVIMDSV